MHLQKQTIKELLLKRDFEKIIFLCNKNVRAFKFLRSCLFSKWNFSKVLKINEPETLGLFAWAMGKVSFEPALPYLKKLLNRSEKVKIYVQGKFWERRIGEWAKGAVKKIEEWRKLKVIKEVRRMTKKLEI